MTILRGLGGSTHPITDVTSATVRASGVITAEVRWLTVESDGTDTNYAPAIWTNGASATLHLTHVTVTASGGSSVNYGVYNNASSPTMNNVSVTASGGTNNWGVYNDNSSATIRDSMLTGSSNSIKNLSGSSAMVANTMLDGSVIEDVPLTYTCFNTYDENFAAVVCP